MNRLFPALLLLAALALGQGAVEPLDWLDIHKSQYRLWMNGAENTFTVDRRVDEQGRLEATYWHRGLGLVVISWPLEE